MHVPSKITSYTVYMSLTCDVLLQFHNLYLLSEPVSILIMRTFVGLHIDPSSRTITITKLPLSAMPELSEFFALRYSIIIQGTDIIMFPV